MTADFWNFNTEGTEDTEGEMESDEETKRRSGDGGISTQRARRARRGTEGEKGRAPAGVLLFDDKEYETRGDRRQGCSGLKMPTGSRPYQRRRPSRRVRWGLYKSRSLPP